MTVFYDDYHCLLCSKTEKKMHTLNDKIDKIVFPGEKLHLSKPLTANIVCDYCGGSSEAFIEILDNRFVGILNKQEITSQTFEQAPITEEVFAKWKNEKSHFTLPQQNFQKQPFNKNKTIKIQDNVFQINKIYRTEWIEKDLDIRLDMPRPDSYWYELSDENNQTKWLKIEDVEGENTLITGDGIVITDQSEIVEEITDHPSKIKSIYKTDWYGGRHIEALQYINGVRVIVKNYKNQVEMDIFEETFETAMESLEENMELGIFNE